MIKPQLPTIHKDVHTVFLLTYLVESFALILETKCRNLNHFRTSDNVVPIQPGETCNVEEPSYFTAGIALHNCVNMSRDSSVREKIDSEIK